MSKYRVTPKMRETLEKAAAVAPGESVPGHNATIIALVEQGFGKREFRGCPRFVINDTGRSEVAGEPVVTMAMTVREWGYIKAHAVGGPEWETKITAAIEGAA